MFLCLPCDCLRCLPAITELMVYWASAGESIKQQQAEKKTFDHLDQNHNNIVGNIFSKYFTTEIGCILLVTS